MQLTLITVGKNITRISAVVSVLCIILSIITADYLAAFTQRQTLFVGYLLAGAWFATCAGTLVTLNERIIGIARTHEKKLSKSLALSLWLTIWLWGFAIFLGSAGTASLTGSPWAFPLDKIFDPSILAGTFIGSATLFALVITFAEVREHLRPKAMAFGEALQRGAAFISEFNAKGYNLKICSYYPPIGAVNFTEYRAEYEAFVIELKRSKVKCLCLASTPCDIKTGADLKTLADRVLSKRPTSIQEAIAAFSGMWYRNEVDNSEMVKKFHAAEQAVLKEIDGLSSLEPMVVYTTLVPDFHFVLASHGDSNPRAGFLLFPLRPAGMPSADKDDKKPPMFGMEIHEPTILNHLDSLYTTLALNGGPTPPPETVKSPVNPHHPAGGNGNGNGQGQSQPKFHEPAPMPPL